MLKAQATPHHRAQPSRAQLALVDFSGQTEFAGANLSITAKLGRHKRW